MGSQLVAHQKGGGSESEWLTLQAQCKAFLASKLLPPTVADLAKALTIAWAGRELGLPPLTALREINIVQGKPCLSSQLMLSLAYQRVPGASVNFLTPPERQSVECEIECSRPGGKSQVFKYTLEMAKNAGLLGKASWKNHPEAMLRARAVSAGCRAVFPDALSGVYTVEELEPVPDMETSDHHPTRPTNNPPAKPPTGNTPGYDKRRQAKMDEPCTEPQRKKLYAMCSAAGYDNAMAHEWLQENFGVDSSADLSKEEIQQAFSLLEIEIQGGKNVSGDNGNNGLGEAPKAQG